MITYTLSSSLGWQPVESQRGWRRVLEYRVDFGPGYRIYFGRDGGRLVILLAGTKKRQQLDVRQAQLNLGRLPEKEGAGEEGWH